MPKPLAKSFLQSLRGAVGFASSPAAVMEPVAPAPGSDPNTSPLGGRRLMPIGLDRAKWETVDATIFDSGVAKDQAAPKAPIAIPDKPSADMLTRMVFPAEDTYDSRQALGIQAEDLLGYKVLRREAGAASHLDRLLLELDIQPFDPQAVAEYKLRMQAHHQAILNAQRQANPVPDDLAMWLDYGTGRLFVEWSMAKLKHYDKPVPEFVLRKCVQIKERAPEAKFFVDELRQRQETLDPFLVVELGSDRAWIEVWDEPEFEKTL